MSEPYVVIEEIGTAEKPYSVFIVRPKRIFFRKLRYGGGATRASAVRVAQDAEAYLYDQGELAKPPEFRIRPNEPCEDFDGRYTKPRG